MEVAPGPKGNRTLPVALVVALVVVIAAFGYYYVESSGEISALNQTVTSESQASVSEASQLAAISAQIQKDNGEISALNSTVAADRAQIATLSSGYAAANTTIASLNGQIGALNSQVTADNAQVASLQSQVSSLQAVASLSDSKAVVQSQSFTTNSSGFVQVASFTAANAGYVAVSVSADSDPVNDGIAINDVFGSGVNSPDFSGIFIPFAGYFYAFGSVPTILVVPVAPGTADVYLMTADASAQTSTLTVTYYY